MDRRRFLGTALAATVGAPLAASAREIKRAPSDAVGLLYDSTRCIGCKACVVACREASGLAPSKTRADGGLHDMQTELDANTKNVIKLWRDEQHRNVFAFMKQQCMHCVDPGCVSVCMLGALKKTDFGIVTYDQDACIGCRYCQIACPYNVPKFEWSSRTPKIVKCELCVDRLRKGLEPACTDICPREAVVFGKLADLKREAHRRIEGQLEKYQQRVYGEEELGGTQVLYLSAVPFVKLGLPEKGTRSGPSVSESIQHGIYQGFATPFLLYAGLAVAVFRNIRKADDKAEEER
jgi:formate dehydrogenase beta subunit